MALEINRLSKGDSDMAKSQVAQVRVYRSNDGLFVGEGDPRGAFLAYAVGAEIPPGDVARYERFMRNEPQDAADSQSKAAQAATDEDVRDELRRRQAGDPAARTPLNQEPVLVHDRLATELADEAAMLAAASPGDAVDDGAVYAAFPVWRTGDGDLVHEGDEAGATLAYPAGARIDDADADEYLDLGEPPEAPEPPAEDTEPKKATRPANKRAPRSADK